MVSGARPAEMIAIETEGGSEVHFRFPSQAADRLRRRLKKQRHTEDMDK